MKLQIRQEGNFSRRQFNRHRVTRPVMQAMRCQACPGEVDYLLLDPAPKPDLRQELYTWAETRHER